MFIISMDLELFRIINFCCRYQPWNTQQKQQVFNVPGIKIDVRNVVVIMHSSFIFNVPPAMQLSCCCTLQRSQRQEILSKQSFWDFIFFLGCIRSSRFHSSKCLNIFNAKWNRVQGQGSPLALLDFTSKAKSVYSKEFEHTWAERNVPYL